MERCAVKHQTKTHQTIRILAAILPIVFLFGLNQTATASEKVLHTFTAGNDGFQPQSLIADSSGNLYGVTTRGGGDGNGVVFKLAPTASGPWKETIVYHFTGGKDGNSPTAIALDAAGNLYGVAQGGIPTSGTPYCKSIGCGTIFRLSPKASGWTFNLLHTFTGMKDGVAPQGITVDPSGNIFVTTFGVTTDYGTVFEMSPTASGLNGIHVYSFAGTAAGDGQNPYGPVIEDSAGNLYGVTQGGGAYALGTVFMLTPGSGGQWTETLIHSFSGTTDGFATGGPLTLDSAGNLWGTADGAYPSFGLVFEMTPSGGGQWSFNALYNFTDNTTGEYPTRGLMLDAAGNIYGETYQGGIVNGQCAGGCGVVFQLTPGSSGWTENILYSFTGANDGFEPWSAPILDGSGNLYSVALFGGKVVSGSCPIGCGVVFEIPGAAVKSK